MTPDNERTKCYYFVDESGDGTLFSKQGEIIVGKSGCSRFFILGLLDVADPEAVTHELEALRAVLLSDPYFKGVPSMQPVWGKTAMAFHAKNDLPEVRREVFKLLLRQRVKFSAIVKDKLETAEYVMSRNLHDPGYRYHPNELYDFLMRRLFKGRLHKADEYFIRFARRGGSDRSAALRAALEVAQERSRAQWGIASDALINIYSGTLPGCGGLQAVDYFLWALQRLYERREERYIQMLWPLCSVVIDVDDTRRARYGAYYTKRKPLSLAAIRKVPGI